MLQMSSTKTTELMKPYCTWMIIERFCKKILFMLTRKPKMTATALHSFNIGLDLEKSRDIRTRLPEKQMRYLL